VKIPRNNRVNYGTFLMWSAVLVALPRWSGAFIAADTAVMPPAVDQALHILNLASGFGLGIIEVVGTAYLLDAWGRSRPRKTWNAKSLDHRWKILTAFVVGLFLLTPLILGPYVYVRMNGSTLSSLPDWFQGLWAIAVVLSPAFIIGGVAVADQGLVPVQDQPVAGKSTAKQDRTGRKHEERPARIQAQHTSPGRQDIRQDAGNLPDDWRQLTNGQRRDLAHATREEREDMFPELAGRTRREWHRRLDEIAAQNGSY
jgi:hypothetical protein